MDKPLCPLGNRFLWVFCLGSGPVFLLFLVLCCLLRCFRWRNASLAGGFAGRRVLVAFCGFCVLYYSICLLKMDMLCPCTNVFPTAYAHVRTEPLARHRPYSREKKSCEETWWRSCIFQSFGVTLRSHWQCFGFPQDFVCNCVHRLERSLHSMVSVLRRLHCSLTVRP